MTEITVATTTNEGPRRSVLWLAEDMEDALRKHDEDRGERGWDKDSVFSLLERVKEETRELEAALLSMNILEARKECADVANFVMMIHDNLRRVERQFRKDIEGKRHEMP